MLEVFNIQLASVDRSPREKINKEILAWNDTLDHPKAAEYPFFSSVCETFTRIDHKLGEKTSLKLAIKITSSIFSKENTMRLEINYQEKNCKKHKHVEAKQPMDHWRSQWRNQNISGEKCKSKHNYTNLYINLYTQLHKRGALIVKTSPPQKTNKK